MYKSPITIFESTIDSFAKSIIKQKDDEIFAEIQHSFGVDLDREELIRALQYDRNQYDKGYADGKADAMADLVRCKDCQHYSCGFCMHSQWWNEDDATTVENDDFCSYGERKDNG